MNTGDDVPNNTVVRGPYTIIVLHITQEVTS